jgi:superfamily I DNA/RNA helicase
MFKNSCIYPEQEDFNSDKFSQFEVAVFRLVYQPYQNLLLNKNAVDFGDLI